MQPSMRLVLAVTAAALLAAPAVARAAEGDIIVQREPGASAKEVRKDADVKLVSTLGIERTELVEPKDGDVAAALADLRDDDDVVSADVDRRVSAATAPNDFYWSALWGLSNVADTDIDAPEAWLRSVGTDVTVAVVDTGVNFTHEDLQGQFAENTGEIPANGIDDDHNGYVDDARGWDFVTEDNVAQDGNGHGTHVAGTIAATGNNGSGLIGVAPSSKVLPLRALDNSGSGFMSDIAAAFDYAGKLGIRIVNASLGGGYASILGSVVASHPDTLYVVAAGNDNADNDNAATASFPCALPEPNVLCVGATDITDARASFSNFGRTTVDLSAPGVGILSAWHSSSNAYRLLSGTSMATPHTAGAAALALAAAPTATTSQLKWALTSSVDVKSSLATASSSKGRLNADAAVAALSGQGPQSVPTPEPQVATPVPTATATPDGHAGHPRGHRDPDADPARPAGDRDAAATGRHPGRGHTCLRAGAVAVQREGRRLAGQARRQAEGHLLALGDGERALHGHGQAQAHHRLDAPQREGRQRRHLHAQAAQRQAAEGRRLHPLGRDQRDREELGRDPRPLSIFFGSGNGDTWSAADTANARGSSLDARSMNS